MHHLMRQRIFQMRPTPHLIRTDQDPMAGTKPASLSPHVALVVDARRAPSTNHIVFVNLAVQQPDLLAQEDDGRRVGEEP